MNEFDLIQRILPTLTSFPHLVVGAGHDCAALEIGIPDRWLLFKTDAVVEGTHFTKETDPGQVGRKALARCLSDLAAMGGTPTACLVTLGLPPGFDVAWVDAFYAGLNKLAAKEEVAVAGGETTLNPERIFVSIAALGTVPKNRCPSRAGAKPGDGIFVTGELGGSITGRHLEFEPRLREGRWLTEHFKPSAMMDLSDGLGGDLRRILHASGVGAELMASAIPISRAAKLRSRSEASAKPPLLAALTDGEDFELLFTVPSREAVALLDGWKAEFPGLRLSCVGRITAEPGLKLRDSNGIRTMDENGYAHFQQP